MIISEVGDRKVGKFFCSDCFEDHNGEHWTVCYGVEYFGELCRGCMSAMVNRITEKLCPREGVGEKEIE